MKEMKMLEYTVVRSHRRTMAIQVDTAAKVIVRAPLRVSDKTINEFVMQKRDWIEANVKKMQERLEDRAVLPALTEEERRALIGRAMEVIPARVAYFAPLVGVSYGRITLRNQKTVWGSCSSKGNLNFNYMLAAFPGEVLDYVVVHELCHRKEMNHSEKFWAEVERIIPDYKVHRKWLKDKGGAYLAK